MQRIIGFIGSIGVGLLMAAAGLYFDVKTLALAGVIILGATVAGWFWAWGTGLLAKAPALGASGAEQALLPAPAERAASNDAKGSRSIEVYRALQNGKAVLSMNNGREAHVWPSVKAALLTLSKEFDLPLIPEEDDARSNLATGLYYLEQIYPLVRAGHVDEARTVAAKLADGG